MQVSALQSIKIFGLWDQPRKIVTWDDLKSLELSWRVLRTDYKFSAQDLKKIQPDKSEWVARGGIQLSDLPEMTIFPVNPFIDLKRDLAEVWAMSWPVELLVEMGVTFDQLKSRGMNTAIMRVVNLPLKSWVQLKMQPHHIESEEDSAIFDLSMAECKQILQDFGSLNK